MVENHVLVDVTHMSGQAIDETLRLLDRLDTERKVPLIATHSAYVEAAAGSTISPTSTLRRSRNDVAS
jgi:microsomal dipeptidase-like Zn-dependent dipeptidase